MGKVLKILGIVVIILIGSTMGMFQYFIGQNNAYKGENPVTYGEYHEDSKKAMVVFQPSKSGITDKAAGALAEGLKTGGYFVMMDYPGQHLSTDVNEYDLIVFGTPVYVGQPSRVLLQYIEKISFTQAQRVYVFSTGSVAETPEWEAVEKALQNKSVTGKIKFLTNQESVLLDQAYQFGLKMALSDG